MQKNVASQRWVCFAFGRTSNSPITGDALNITGNLRLDGGAANPIDDTNPQELEAGYYYFDLSQAETNADMIVIIPVSATPDVIVIGVPGAVWTEPAGLKYPATLAPGDCSGNLPVEVKAEDNLDFGALKKLSLNAATPAGIQGTTQTLDALAALLRGADSDTLKTLSDQIDLQALETSLTAIKGSGWSTQTLKAISDAVALCGLEATLTAIKGTGWTTETLKAIKAAVLAASYTTILQGLTVTLSPNLLTVNLDGIASQIEIKSGEAKTVLVTVKDASGVAVNLSAATLTLGIKKIKSDTAYIISKANADFDKSLAAQGIVGISLTALETAVAARTYIGELKCSWTGPPATVNKSADFFFNVKAAVT